MSCVVYELTYTTLPISLVLIEMCTLNLNVRLAYRTKYENLRSKLNDDLFYSAAKDVHQNCYRQKPIEDSLHPSSPRKLFPRPF